MEGGRRRFVYSTGRLLACALVPFVLVLWVACSNPTNDASDSDSAAATDTETTEPLTWMEEQVCKKWSRYHAYDGSSQYYAFAADRKACAFEFTSSGSRVDVKCYVYWRLVPTADDDVYDIEVTYSSGSTYAMAEYHYAADEVWRGGYSNLVMRPSTTSRTCGCDWQ